MIIDFIRRIRAGIALGLANVLRVLLYRFQKKTGLLRRRAKIERFSASGQILVCDRRKSESIRSDPRLMKVAHDAAAGNILMFGFMVENIDVPPDWLVNPLNKATCQQFAGHWSDIPDFNRDIGDIKTVWELSRFSWVLLFARAHVAVPGGSYLSIANSWLVDWLDKNPVNQGPGWMSGQEVAIRLIHLLLADAILRGKERAPLVLVEFVVVHCIRMELTIGYELAQNNNHGVSVGAGLFFGGVWLCQHSGNAELEKQGRRWAARGKKTLENMVRKLIMNDGTFSQYSMTYHRLLLDTLAAVEWWRSKNSIARFSSEFYEKASLATEWLFEFVDVVAGEVANVGANDGALVYSFSECGHRDFRPTLQLAGALFCDRRFFAENGPWNEPLDWLGVAVPEIEQRQSGSVLRQEGGFGILRAIVHPSYAIYRFPNYQFRPSQSDALHVDLWCNGVNICRDGGSYSYAAAAPFDTYFMGVESHNTVQFSNRDQMPKIGRFLFADWLKTENLRVITGAKMAQWGAAYTDFAGCRHERQVEASGNCWRITDCVSGPFKTATLRWRLCPDYQWQLTEDGADAKEASIKIQCDQEVVKISIEKGWESKNYLQLEKIPVLTVMLNRGHQSLVTRIELKK